jgi:MFS transporter, NNP family, nitrate/nitrite transporter
MLLAFLAGLGGGNFSSFMPSTSLFFPKRLQGTALAIQAGIGNFGVSIVQFVTPWIIGVTLLGGATFLGESQTMTRAGVESQVYLQNAPAVFIPFIAVFGITAWLLLKSVPIKANFAEQFDIFRERHTWSMTSLYIMTFGAFSGLAATFPLLIRSVYGEFEGAPDPLAWAFWGPLVGSASRVIAGPLSDKLGGARVTHWAGLGMLVCALLVTLFLAPTSLDSFPYFVAAMLALFFFAGVGNASTFKQMPMIFPPRQAGGVIGFTAAIGAYGPFALGLLFAWSFGAFGSATPDLLRPRRLLRLQRRAELVALRPQRRRNPLLRREERSPDESPAVPPPMFEIESVGVVVRWQPTCRRPGWRRSPRRCAAAGHRRGSRGAGGDCGRRRAKGPSRCDQFGLP